MSKTHDSTRPRPSRKHGDLSVLIVPHFMGNSNGCLVTPLTAAAVSATGRRFTVFLIFYHTSDDESNNCPQNDQYKNSSHFVYAPSAGFILIIPFLYHICNQGSDLINTHGNKVCQDTLVSDRKPEPLRIVHLSLDSSHCSKARCTEKIECEE